MSDIWAVLDNITTLWFKVILFVTFPIWFLPALIYVKIKYKGQG